jgi:hypothetical protein
MTPKRTGLDSLGLGISPAPQQEEGASLEPTLPKSPSVKKLKKTAKPHLKQHTAYLPLAVHEQLRHLAFQERCKIHDLLLEGLDRVFADRGLKSVEELKGKEL